jgi:hypothetical protein
VLSQTVFGPLFIVFILYSLLALTLEPLYMDLVGFFHYPKKPGRVPTLISIGWGLLVITVLFLSHSLSYLLAALFNSPIMVFTSLFTLTFLGHCLGW